MLVGDVSRGDGEGTDFGVAKTAGARHGAHDRADDPASEGFVGTPLYMAPEQLRGEEATPGWDLWAMAVMASEMLSGRHPFAELMARGAERDDRTRAVGATDGRKPEVWRPFFDRALAADPARRPASGQAFNGWIARGAVRCHGGRMNEDGGEPQRDGHFATTHWSSCSPPGDNGARGAGRRSLSCAGPTWYPLYAYVRRWGYSADDAQDLTQEFFARVLEKHYLRQADPARGRFRSFLLASLKHFLANERDRARAQKRGGGAAPLPFEFETAEGGTRANPPDDETPDRIFERRWALALLERVLGRLRDENYEAGKTFCSTACAIC